MDIHFLDSLFRFFSHPRHGTGLARSAGQLLLHRFEAALQLLVIVAVALAIAAAIIGVYYIIHISLNSARRQGAWVFISYQHEHESMASQIASTLRRLSMAPLKLPFLPSVEHDDLLENVRTAIERCDVVVCLPGKNASFVEHEVAMAHALNKPILFLLNESTHRWLPNTAKKGYPILDSDASQRDGFRVLAEFCSYLGADARSTSRLYLSTLNLWPGILAWALMMQLLVYFGDMPVSSVPPEIVIALSSVILFTLIITSVLIVRSSVRRNTRRVVSGRRYDVRLLPAILHQSLKSKDLERLQFRGAAVARHEEASDVTLVVDLRSSLVALGVKASLCLGIGAAVLFNWRWIVGLDGDGFEWRTLVTIPVAILACVIVYCLAVELYSVAPRILGGARLRLDREGIRNDLADEKHRFIPWRSVTKIKGHGSQGFMTLSLAEETEPVTVSPAYFPISTARLVSFARDFVPSARQRRLARSADARVPVLALTAPVTSECTVESFLLDDERLYFIYDVSGEKVISPLTGSDKDVCQSLTASPSRFSQHFTAEDATRIIRASVDHSVLMKGKRAFTSSQLSSLAEHLAEVALSGRPDRALKLDPGLLRVMIAAADLRFYPASHAEQLARLEIPEGIGEEEILRLLQIASDDQTSDHDKLRRDAAVVLQAFFSALTRGLPSNWAERLGLKMPPQEVPSQTRAPSVASANEPWRPARSPMAPWKLLTLFLRPARYFADPTALAKYPEILIAMWICGMSWGAASVINLALDEAPFFPQSWPLSWSFVVVFGLFGGAIYWFVGGWWYAVRVRWSGVSQVETVDARRVYLYQSLVVDLPAVAVLIVQTFQHPDPSAAANATDLELIVPCFALLSCYTGYRAAVSAFGASRWKAAGWFLVGPLLVYGLMFI